MTHHFLMSDVDEYGFIRSEEENLMKSVYYEILTRRAQRWSRVFSNGKIIAGRRLKRFIRKGVPLNLRLGVWMKVSGAETAYNTSPNVYNLALNTQFQKEIVEIIKLDIPRTFPENIYFDVHKNELFNVLVAFAHQNSDVGYCQGLNYIAGLILIVTKNEASTFWLLKHLVENVAPEYHTRTMFGLQRDIHVITEIVRAREPLVDEKMNELGFPWTVILSKWLICLFAEFLPVETVLRVWDVMFAEGYKIIFRAALAIIFTLKEDIMNAQDMTVLSEVFRNCAKDPRILDCHAFLERMFKIKLKRRDIDVLRKNYKL